MKKKVSRALSWAVVAAIFALPLMPLTGAIDMFLSIDDIQGESTNDKYKDQIEVLAWSWGATNSGTTHTGQGGGTGAVDIQDLTVTKFIDKASASLMLHCANGKHFNEAKMTMTKTIENNTTELLVLTMKDVLVTSMASGGEANDTRMTEKVKLNFAWFKIEYTQTDQDGTSLGTTQMYWDIVQNDGG